MPNVVWDVVEMYNYAKTTPLTANHGTLVNYTDNELGIPDVSQQTAFQDFYEKNSNPENWYESPVQPNEEDNIEVHSQLPPPVKALQFNGTSQYLRVPAINFNGSYLAVMTMKVPNAQGSFAAWYGFDNPFGGGLLYDATGDTLQTWSTSARKSRSLANWSYGEVSNYAAYSRIVSNTYDLTICTERATAGRFVEGELCYFALFQAEGFGDQPADDRIWLNGQSGDPNNGLDKIVKRLWNNSLLRNPSIQDQADLNLELLVDLNSPFDDAGTFKFPDLSPNAHDIEAVGWADLTDLENSLVDIASLR